MKNVIQKFEKSVKISIESEAISFAYFLPLFLPKIFSGLSSYATPHCSYNTYCGLFCWGGSEVRHISLAVLLEARLALLTLFQSRYQVL